MKIKSFVITCILFHCCFFVKAQTPEKDILEMNRVYAAAKSFSMQVEMRMYSQPTDVKPLRVEKGSVAKNGDNYFSEMLGKTVVVNDRYHLVVDADAKLMLVSKPEKGKFDLAGMGIDSSGLKGYSLKYLSQSNSIRKIEIAQPADSEYEIIIVSVNPKTHLLEEVEYVYRSIPGEEMVFKKVVLTYKTTLFNQPVPAAVFAEKKYFTTRGGAIIPSALYTTFRIIDQRKKVTPKDFSQKK